MGHGFGYPIGSFDVRGEFYSFCEGYPSHACSLIALNVHMKRRLWERYEEFEESLVDYKDKKVITFFSYNIYCVYMTLSYIA